MSDYTYDPKAWHPMLAGATAGAVAAIVAALVSLVPRTPGEAFANSLTVTAVALVLGVLSGMLWRRIRTGPHAIRTFAWTMAGGWFFAMLAVSFGEFFLLDNLIGYAAPLAAIIFLTLGFLVPLFASATAPTWIGFVVIAAAIALGIFLLGKGNVASGDLSLDDLDEQTTTTTQVVTTDGDSTTGTSEAPSTTAPTGVELSGQISIPDDLAGAYDVTNAIATYEVPELLQGISTVGVGETNEVTGGFSPGGEFTFTIDLQSFVSDQSRRDSRVRQWFAEFPTGTFSGSDFDLPSAATVGEPVTFSLTGDLTINEITMPTTWDIEARVEPNGTLSILGETDITLSDFDVDIIESGFVTMEDAAHLEVLVSATPS